VIFKIPNLTVEDRAVLRLISAQRNELKHLVASTPRRWNGFLRRTTLARAMQGSNSIEGINADLSDIAEIIGDEKPETLEEETLKALTGYRAALTFVLQIHSDPYFELNAQTIKSMHFMMMSYDLTKMPGQWRPSAIFVRDEAKKEIVYEAPDAELVPALMEELADQYNGAIDVDPVIKGAMIHLNLAMIHPFKDGNGRMARALQTLAISRHGILSPVFSSIEEWLGRNTFEYYKILADTGQGRWRPENDAQPWVRFCLTAHFQQAATLIKRSRELEAVWNAIAEITKTERLPGRSEIALANAAFGFRVRNNLYRADNDISEVVASRDLKRLCELDLLRPVGEKRGRYYLASPKLRELRERFRDKKRARNPYDMLKDLDAANEPRLPGLT
jgi:Fic family protein